MQIGYVRVSTNYQNTDLQRQALERAGCEQVFEEKMGIREILLLGHPEPR